jgi:hypothetical protein
MVHRSVAVWRSHTRALAAACLLVGALFVAGIPEALSGMPHIGSPAITVMACDPANCKCAPSWINCTGQDPNVIGCIVSSTQTLAVYFTNNDIPEQTYDSGYTQNRWATDCKSNWGRTYTNSQLARSIYASISGTDSQGHSWSNTNGYASSALLWSLMIYSPVNVTTACGGFTSTMWNNTSYGPNWGCKSQ